ncbi:MAG: hypothetical protein EPN85_00680 [Bacteroidetes bacterium]|nr:MAG: hypothetical protein EPN85_00680 [Bacteroidota bacterium]
MKKLVLVSGLLLIAPLAFSQYKWDFGGHLGATNCLGEIGGKEKTRRDFILDLKLSQTRSAIGGFARYKIHPDILIRGSVGWYRISGADKFSTNPGRVGRNLSFRNDIIEASVTGQYVFYDIADLGRTYRYRNDFKAYVFTGAAGAYHNPKAEYNGSWVALQPLHTEGQGIVEGAPKPYSRFIFVVPAGAGFFFTLQKKYRIGWEFNWRTTFTDYLDDVSTVYADPNLLESDEARDLANRNDELVYADNPDLPDPQNYYPHIEGGVMKYPKRGDPKHNDSYLSTTINASVLIKGKSKFGKHKYKSFFGKQYKGRTIRAKF